MTYSEPTARVNSIFVGFYPYMAIFTREAYFCYFRWDGNLSLDVVDASVTNCGDQLEPLSETRLKIQIFFEKRQTIWCAWSNEVWSNEDICNILN